jgi:hypothetical protein
LSYPGVFFSIFETALILAAGRSDLGQIPPRLHPGNSRSGSGPAGLG